METFIRYTSGLGDSALYARLRNGSGQFWDFTNGEWQAGNDADTKITLTEVSDGDPSTSFYGASITIPTDNVYMVEITLVADGTVIGYESTMGAVLAARTSNYETGEVVDHVGNTAQFFLTDLTSSISSYCVGSYLKFTSGTLINQVRRISSYSGTTFFVAVSSAFSAEPTAADTFIIINQ